MRKASLGNTWAQQQFEYYSSSVCSLTDQSFLLILQFPGGESAYRFFFQGHFFKRKRKWTCWVWRGKTHGAKTETRRTVTSGNLVCVCVCVWRSGWAVWWRPGVTVRLSETLGLPPAELSRGSSLPTGGTGGSSGGGLQSAGQSPALTAWQPLMLSPRP